VAGLRVCLTSWLLGWQDRRLVTARMPYLMFVCLAGWMPLRRRSSPPRGTAKHEDSLAEADPLFIARLRRFAAVRSMPVL